MWQYLCNIRYVTYHMSELRLRSLTINESFIMFTTSKINPNSAQILFIVDALRMI